MPAAYGISNTIFPTINKSFHFSITSDLKDELVECDSLNGNCVNGGQHFIAPFKPQFNSNKFSTPINVNKGYILDREKQKVFVSIAQYSDGREDITIAKGSILSIPVGHERLIEKFLEMNIFELKDGTYELIEDFTMSPTPAAQIIKQSIKSASGRRAIILLNGKKYYDVFPTFRTRTANVADYPEAGVWMLKMNKIKNYPFLFSIFANSTIFNIKMGTSEAKIAAICKKAGHIFHKTLYEMHKFNISCPNCTGAGSSAEEQQIISDLKNMQDYIVKNGKDAEIKIRRGYGIWSAKIAKFDGKLGENVMIESDRYYLHNSIDGARKDADKSQTVLNMGIGVIRMRFGVQNFLAIQHDLYREFDGTGMTTKQMALTFKQLADDIYSKNISLKR